MCVAGQGVVPGGYVIAEGPGGVPMAFPVRYGLPSCMNVKTT